MSDGALSKSGVKTLLTSVLKKLIRNGVVGNPIGTIIPFMGKTAPGGYFICDGSTYNIEDYSDFAEYLITQFGSVNYFGGDGETTFAVPDLRGEFLRGTGTSSYSGQGSGADVGTHQAATSIPNFWSYSNSCAVVETNGWGSNVAGNMDSTYTRSGRTAMNMVHDSYGTEGGTYIYQYTSRPTNTSVLYCIKY